MDGSGGGQDSLMTSLKVLSSVKHHERINTQGPIISVDSAGWLQPLRRWWQSESRDINLSQINTIIDNAFSQLTLRQKNTDKNTTSNKIFIMRLTKELEGAVEGLTNLRTTYQDDLVAVARIDLLVDKIKSNLEIQKIKQTVEKQQGNKKSN